MDWYDPSTLPPPLTPAPSASVEPVVRPADPVIEVAPVRLNIRRTVLTAALSALLLVGGAAAVVSAASPDPGASSAPSTTQPSGVPGTRPNGGTHDSANCPNMGGSSGGSGSSGSNAAPTPAS